MKKNLDSFQNKKDIPFGQAVRKILKEKGISFAEAAEKMGYSKPQGFYSLLDKGNPELFTLIKLSDKLDISPSKLMQHIIDPDATVHYDPDEVVVIPYVPISGHASFVEHYDDYASQTFSSYPVSRKAFDGRIANRPEKYLTAQVKGDSMAPELTDRSIVVMETISKDDWKYTNGGVYAVIFGNQFVFKRIISNKILEEGRITLVSDNEKYGSLVVDANDIRYMGKVLGAVEKRME